MVHDFKEFPELTNSQMSTLYFESPHKQITEDFTAEVVGVHDGDSVRLKCDFRDFVFPFRIMNIAAPELDEEGGIESQRWLEENVLGKVVDIKINPKIRIGAWSRLMGRLELEGQDIGNLSVMQGHSLPWNARSEWH